MVKFFHISLKLAEILFLKNSWTSACREWLPHVRKTSFPVQTGLEGSVHPPAKCRRPSLASHSDKWLGGFEERSLVGSNPVLISNLISAVN